MAKRRYLGRGAAGLKGRPKLREEVVALSDEAKRKRLERNVGENQKRIKKGKKARTISDSDIDKFVSKFRTPTQKIRRLQGRAAAMREKAAEVERSGTGNVKAAATYRQVAREALKRAAALRKGK